MPSASTFLLCFPLTVFSSLLLSLTSGYGICYTKLSYFLFHNLEKGHYNLQGEGLHGHKGRTLTGKNPCNVFEEIRV